VLTGFIGYQGKTLCFVTETTMTFEPKMVRSYYGIGHYNAREDADLIGRAARYTGFTVEVQLGAYGQVLRWPLAGTDTPIHSEVTDIPAPKTRCRTRWENGAWRKYLARQGWVCA